MWVLRFEVLNPALVTWCCARTSSLRHEGTRDSLGLELQDNIVVFDEAHNVFDAAGDSYSLQVSEAAL